MTLRNWYASVTMVDALASLRAEGTVYEQLSNASRHLIKVEAEHFDTDAARAHWAVLRPAIVMINAGMFPFEGEAEATAFASRLEHFCRAIDKGAIIMPPSGEVH